ncbi:hypothetical protein E4T45_04516 [Aureobasidium sp. EXF-8846]|nr:hypothetical protein E4T45_04516 [Aureobasidium sp. EXF-8846]
MPHPSNSNAFSHATIQLAKRPSHLVYYVQAGKQQVSYYSTSQKAYNHHKYRPQKQEPKHHHNNQLFQLFMQHQKAHVKSSITLNLFRQASFEAYKKVGFVLDLLNTRNADLEHKIKQQQAQIEALIVKKRRKVLVNPNTKFANIENVIIAQGAAQQIEQQEAERATIFYVE